MTDLNLSVKKGEHTLLRGRNGAGKTSIFRTLGGLWPAADAGGAPAEVALPPNMAFVPQRTYLTDGTLIDQLTYPVRRRGLAAVSRAASRAPTAVAAAPQNTKVFDKGVSRRPKFGQSLGKAV